MEPEGALNLSHNSIFNEQRVLSPEKSLAASGGSLPEFTRGFPRSGDKKSEEPILLTNSASQTLVKFAVELTLTVPTVNLVFWFSQPVLLAATVAYLPQPKRVSTES